MSSKVLLVNPPFYRLLGSHYNANSLGIAYIASYLNSHGHDAWLYNADFLSEKEYINLKNIFESFVDYKEYFEDENNDIWEEVVSKINEFEPDWVGYTSYTANVTAIDIISRKLKLIRPKVKQVIGGVHATLDHEVLKKLSAINYSVQREGEEAMLALVEGESSETISGVVSRNAFGLNNNGDAEVITASEDGHLIILHLDGTYYENYPIKFDYGFESSPTVMDLDNDNDLEIIIGTTQNLSVVDIKETSIDGQYYWYTYRGDNKRTGTYIYSGSNNGDINNDGIANVQDLVILVNMILGNIEMTESGDINSDGSIDVLDVVHLVNIILDV